MPVENISKKPTFLLNKRVNLKEKIHSAFKAPSVVCVDKQNVLPYLLDPKNLNEDELLHSGRYLLSALINKTFYLSYLMLRT